MPEIILLGGSRLFRNGLKAMLSDAGLAVGAQAAACDDIEAVLAEAPQADLILVRLNPLQQDVVAVLGQVRLAAPAHRIVIISPDLSTEALVNAFAAGADGFLLEDISLSALRSSLGLIRTGEKVFPSQLAVLLGTTETGEAPPFGGDRYGPLSHRETDILRHLAGGLSNKEIAIELDLAVATVKVHVKSVLKKLGVHNRTQAAVWALENGVVEAPRSAETTRPGAESRHFA